MTENLRLGRTEGETILTPNDSDVTDTITLPVAEHDTANRWADSWLDSAGADQWHTYATGNDVYGNVYNWYTATSGTGSSSDTSGDASSSICAKNWGLPAGTGNKSWDNLMDVYSINITSMSHTLDSPLSFTKSGIYFYDTGYGANGLVATYWTKSSAYLDVALVADAMDADYNGLYFNTRHPGAKVDGYAVRCAAR